MTYCARIRKIKAPKMSGLILVLAVLLVTSGGSAGGSAALGTPHTLGPASESAQGNVYHPAANGDWDWPQVQRDPQRTGYTPEVLGTNFQVAWTHPFQPEKVYPAVQAIVYEDKVFVGTEMGNMYALDAQTGDQEWVYNVGAPILNSVAAGDGKAFFGAMDGAVYALDVTTGSLAWKSQLSWRLGFSTAPVYAENKVMLGGRDGIFYALDPDTGATLWQYDVGSPILQTAAWNNGRVFFGAMDMHVYAINTADGSLAWQSEKIPGMAFKDYWPVVYDGKVVIRPMARGPAWLGYGLRVGFPFVGMWDSSDPNWDWVMQHGPTIAEGRLTDIPDAMDAQDAAMADYQANPGNYTKNLLILDEATGEEAFAVPHWTGQTMNGATTPPCVDRDGTLVVPVSFIRSGWGRLDVTLQRITDILYDHTDHNGGPMDPGDVPAGMGNDDETLNVSCTGNLVIGLHTSDHHWCANYNGVFELDNRQWSEIRQAHTNKEMSTNTQGGGGNPASISDGMVYHISWHELIVRSAQP